MKSANLQVYFRERFPLPAVFLLSVIFAMFVLALGHSLDYAKFCLLVLLFVALLLRQRVTDEFKDNGHDATYFPDRPYQRGVISRNELLALGAVAMAVELLTVYLMGGVVSLGWYLPVFIYSLIMAKEFFLSSWLNRHFTIYFLIHEAIFILIGIWALKLMNAPLTITSWAWLIAFVGGMMCIEIVRKFDDRFDTHGKVVKDTYAIVWGEGLTRSVLELLLLTTGIALAYAESMIAFAVVGAVVALMLNLLRPHGARLQAVVAIYLLAVAAKGMLV